MKRKKKKEEERAWYQQEAVKLHWFLQTFPMWKIPSLQAAVCNCISFHKHVNPLRQKKNNQENSNCLDFIVARFIKIIRFLCKLFSDKKGQES